MKSSSPVLTALPVPQYFWLTSFNSDNSWSNNQCSWRSSISILLWWWWSQKYCGTGKAVNTGDEDFIFTRCHRGYGGVAILWSKCIDPLVKVFKEGNSRIQCIELKTNIPILCISTYLPTKVENDLLSYIKNSQSPRLPLLLHL
jgi:hypothetical protein